ncbi:MAG: hypothetical protein OQK82_03465 [Candidatus Pacearchaeota archaeon]|nr:hypothetical protein [Candidatus Pacearchaeota archaeon]
MDKNKIKQFIKKHPVWVGIIIFVWFSFTISPFISEDNTSSTSNINIDTAKQTQTDAENINVDYNEQTENIGSDSSAIELVSPKLNGLPDLNIDENDLETIKNPYGDGIFVYVAQTNFYGVKRLFLWVIIDEQAYAVNGATKSLTPDLPYPREAPSKIWDKTGLDVYSAEKAISVVFGE